ncbi:hypothetical protein BIFPSEUDO_02488 [Bifidobacterium pseudocatenulatum DSM 20438 = JCM 1200 = LMG 10505]|uniref:Uncharacterized protein n=1 Tax=Bifidobacterium pseudocatenulatum DSM 20438 = JCM 1200 = LMG 10505 TaxID=547043 RepID=C0BQ48_BIFPS|nr:hypothetical protein BIFPSEUDO_02488 [Bifidobacterium pseudocatenulatum DSM 20438 = JCM 1200 = LMG 10505]BAR03133.1 hypothetical protein BBPC_0455 [Bifidobacterium pseudocatenulatum DSM 20438 = JCM 1200 = LMG 10505]
MPQPRYHSKTAKPNRYAKSDSAAEWYGSAIQRFKDFRTPPRAG